MKAPGLFRLASARAAGWRLLFLFAAAAAVPATLATLPLLSFLSSQLDHALQAEELARALDAGALADLAKALTGSPGGGAGVAGGLAAGALAALLLAPVPVGAALAAARTDARLPLRELLRGAGEHYGRLLRMTLVAALPLGAAAGFAAAAVGAARGARERALTEAAADRALLPAALAAAALAWLAQLTLDAGRAQLAARPSRRSALLAWGAGVGLLWRRPLPGLALGLAGTAGLAAALLLAAIRQRWAPGVGGLLLAQLSAACVGWGHGMRLIGLSALARADDAERVRRRADALRAASAAPPAQAQPRPGGWRRPPDVSILPPAPGAGREPKGPGRPS